jgi:hypothetical protein
MASLRRAAPVAFGLVFAAAALKLAACGIIDPGPPIPHGEDPSDLTQAPDAYDASDASEEP